MKLKKEWVELNKKNSEKPFHIKPLKEKEKDREENVISMWEKKNWYNIDDTHDTKDIHHVWLSIGILDVID